MLISRAEILMRSGIDCAEAIERFGGNESLYERLAKKFIDDPHFAALDKALEAGDSDLAFREAHALKGVAGNLSFTALYEAACRLSDALRNGDTTKARELMDPLRKAHTAVMDALATLE